jgi:multiple sugar transport system ATP-binding protein
MTVFDNIAFPLRIKRVARDAIVARVRAVADTVHVGHLLDKRPATLSGGEAQRVALARTLVVEPAVFLMDEPLSSLDAKLRVEMRTELKRLHGALRSTFVYVTHDQAEAMTMADRIVVMHRGHIEQVGPPLEVYADPATRFVAGFFGVPAMNFVDGNVQPGRGGLDFTAPALRMTLPGRAAPAGPAVLGVRPEHVRVANGAGGCPATVSLIEPLGDETLVFLDYGGPASLVAKVNAEEKIDVGERRSLTFRTDRVVFFDPATGARIRV